MDWCDTWIMVKIPAKAIRNWITKNFTYKERNDEILICSPFDHDTKYKFNINPELGLCHDWRGDGRWAGTPSAVTGKRNCSFVKFVQLYRQCSYYEAIKEILGNGFVIDIKQPEKKETISDVSLPEGAKLLGDSTDTFSSRVTKYLKSRGVDDDQIKLHKLHYHAFDIIWPYYEYDELVYWQSRSIMKKMFMFPKDTDKSNYIYGFDLVEPASYLIIVEAIFGVHTLGSQTIATGGASLADGQFRKIKLLGPKDGVILSPDFDQAGIDSILHNYKLLNGTYKTYYSIIPEIEIDGKLLKDWNELYTDAKMKIDEIRNIFNSNIKPLDNRELMKLAKLSQLLKKVRS